MLGVTLTLLVGTFWVTGRCSKSFGGSGATGWAEIDTTERAIHLLKQLGLQLRLQWVFPWARDSETHAPFVRREIGAHWHVVQRERLEVLHIRCSRDCKIFADRVLSAFGLESVSTQYNHASLALLRMRDLIARYYRLHHIWRLCWQVRSPSRRIIGIDRRDVNNWNVVIPRPPFRGEVCCGRMTDVPKIYVDAAVPAKLVEVRENAIFSADGDPRSLGSLKFFLRFCQLVLKNSGLAMHRKPLEESDSGVYPSASDGGNRNPAVDLVVALVLLPISAILLKYRIWNLYDGPCDWRSVACLVGGWIPFTAGRWIVLSLLTHNVTGRSSISPYFSSNIGIEFRIAQIPNNQIASNVVSRLQTKRLVHKLLPIVVFESNCGENSCEVALKAVSFIFGPREKLQRYAWKSMWPSVVSRWDVNEMAALLAISIDKTAITFNNLNVTAHSSFAGDFLAPVRDEYSHDPATIIERWFDWAQKSNIKSGSIFAQLVLPVADECEQSSEYSYEEGPPCLGAWPRRLHTVVNSYSRLSGSALC